MYLEIEIVVREAKYYKNIIVLVKNIAVHWVVLLFFDEFRGGQDANQSRGGTKQKYSVSVTSDGQEKLSRCV